ncbi:MAG: aconitate hydratase AcnA [Elusimicrobia bacterium]|nr:aconitate hydratase AcnA [Candidatus Obscuribacterium magneticum]
MKTKKFILSFQWEGKAYSYFSLAELERSGFKTIGRLPFTLKILLENLLRREDGVNVKTADIEALASWAPGRPSAPEISFMPARVLLQDFTGVPCLVDLASMRDAVAEWGGDSKRINPRQPVDLVIDHSLQVDYFGVPEAFRQNVEMEYRRNAERYSFLKWGQRSFQNFRVVPPGTGIIHQVNLEYLGDVVGSKRDGNEILLFPDTVIGTDSHTTMINGLGVLGWGVGGIEAEAALLGQPLSMLVPEVVGFRLVGKLREGVTATDLVLTVTEKLRKKGVVGKFVEFLGPGLMHLSLADRATIANMAPEYGATTGFFPVDEETLAYLRLTGRSETQVRLVEKYCKEQGLFWSKDLPEPLFSDRLELDLAHVMPSLAGPRRPHDRIELEKAGAAFEEALPALMKKIEGAPRPPQTSPLPQGERTLMDGDIVIAAITSCTNTSNPSVMVQAGLLAQKAVARGLTSKPWVKTSLAPGSKVVMDYLEKAGLVEPLQKIGFYLVGYGCTTCIGNAGPLPENVERQIKERELVVVSALSGNRNFEGRIHPLVRANYLMSPPLVVAYAVAGTIKTNLQKDPLGTGADGKPVYLKDIWPSEKEVQAVLQHSVKAELFRKEYSHVFNGDEHWEKISFPKGERFGWQKQSTYVRRAPFLENLSKTPQVVADVKGARVLALLGDSITTDHISPAGSISEKSPAGQYLLAQGVKKVDFNSYGARRGNHEVMMRGTFANSRLKNLLIPGTEGGLTKKFPGGQVVSIYEAAVTYQKEGVPLIVMAGKEYGSGSSRDWAAKGVALLGVRAVLAISFERIHRSNLVMMGVLPLQYKTGESAGSLGLTGEETIDIDGLSSALKPLQNIKVKATLNGKTNVFDVVLRIDTPKEVDYYQHGGVLPYVLRQVLK